MWKAWACGMLQWTPCCGLLLFLMLLQIIAYRSETLQKSWMFLLDEYLPFFNIWRPFWFVSFLTQNIDTLLRCPICFDYLNVSMMTQCSHNCKYEPQAVGHIGEVYLYMGIGFHPVFRCFLGKTMGRWAVLHVLPWLWILYKTLIVS